MGNITWTKSYSASDNGIVLAGTDIQNIQSDITTVVNGNITNSNIKSDAGIVFSKFSTGAATADQVFKADGSGSGSFQNESSNKHYRKGFTLKAGSTADSDIVVTPGSIDVGGTVVTATADSSDIAVATDGNWKDGTAPGSIASIWIYVLIDDAGNIKLDENPPSYSYTDETTAEYPLRYHKQTTTYYRYLGAVFSDAASDLCFGVSDGSNPPIQEGLYVSQFDASNVCVVNGLGTGSDQVFSTIWTPKHVSMIYGITNTNPAASDAIQKYYTTQKMLDTNWHATALNVRVTQTEEFFAINNPGTVNAITAQAAGTAGGFTIDAMTDNKFFYVIAYTDIL